MKWPIVPLVLNLITVINLHYTRVAYLQRGRREVPVLFGVIGTFVLVCYVAWSIYGFLLLFVWGHGCLSINTLLTVACLIALWGFFMLLFGIAMIVLAVLILSCVMICCPHRIRGRQQRPAR